jgi:hypothetical protein
MSTRATVLRVRNNGLLSGNEDTLDLSEMTWNLDCSSGRIDGGVHKASISIGKERFVTEPPFPVRQPID